MKTTILKFYSKTCMPCKLLTNVLKEANIEHQSIDIADERNEDLVAQYNIRNVPVLIKVDYQGHEINRLGGFPGTKAVEEFCNENS